MQLQETRNTSIPEINTAVWAIGESDLHKVRAIWTIISELAKEPSEVIVICPDINLAEIYDSCDGISTIPIAYDLKQIAKILNQLIDELQDRQRRLKCYGEISHRIIVAIELDHLAAAFEKRAIELGVSYNERELSGAIEMLREEGAKVEIYLIGSTDEFCITSNCARFYSGTEALKFTLGNSEVGSDIASQTMGQKNPCCLFIDGDIYSVEVKSNATAGIEQVREELREILFEDCVNNMADPTPQPKTGFFQKIRGLVGSKSN